jgi:hypothetical protein
MIRNPQKRLPRLRPSGKTNLIGVAVIAAVIYGVWWIITWSGVYLDNLDVVDAVKGAYNDSGRKNDQGVLDAVVFAPGINTAGTHDEDDGFGNIKTDVPGLGIKKEDVTVTRDDVKQTIRIEVVYTRKVPLKPFKKVELKRFRVVKEGAIPQIK